MSATRARLAHTEIACAVATADNWFFSTVENLFFTTVEIDFYHRGNWLLPPWKLIFTTLEIDFLLPLKIDLSMWKIDFYHCGNWFLPPWKLIFTTVMHKHTKIVGKCNLQTYHWRYLVSFEFITITTLNKSYNLTWKAFWWHANSPYPSSNNFCKPPFTIKRGLKVKFSPFTQ